MLNKNFIKSNYSNSVYLLVNSVHWKDVTFYDKDKINAIEKLIKGIRTTDPNKKQLKFLYENENPKNIIYYYIEYNKLSPNEKKVRSERNFILYYGKIVGRDKWNKYNKINKLPLKDRLKLKYKDEYKEKEKEWKKNLSIKQNEKYKNMSEEDKKAYCICNDEYWEKYREGFSEKEKKEKLKNRSEKLSKSTSKIWVKRREEEFSYKDKTPACIEYWTNKGYNDIEAEEKRLLWLKENCITNEERLCKKYGEEEGKERWKNCLKKRKNSMLKRIKDGLYMSSNSSKEANDIFKEVIKNIKTFIDINDIYTAKNKNGEYYIAKGNEYYYSYDFTIRSKNIIIEYNNLRWHPHPLYMNREEWKNWSIFEWKSPQLKYIQDRRKIKKAREKGFYVLEIWNTDDNKIQKCVDFIKNNIKD